VIDWSQALELGGGFAGLAALLGVLGRWSWTAWRSRAERHSAAVEADASVRVAQVIAEERVGVELIRAGTGEAERLWQRLEVVEGAQQRCEEERLRDREACGREISDLRAELGRVSARLGERWRDEGLDDTGVHEVEEVARKTSTPPGWRVDVDAEDDGS